ncbi:hypothetical protein BDV19DRAFT_354674 [Aspergillus venezuelensis]
MMSWTPLLQGTIFRIVRQPWDLLKLRFFVTLVILMRTTTHLALFQRPSHHTSDPCLPIQRQLPQGGGCGALELRILGVAVGSRGRPAQPRSVLLMPEV